MASNSLTASFEGLDKIVKVILILFLGWLVSGLYRVIRYTETKNVVTLVVGLIALLSGVGNFIFCIAHAVWVGLIKFCTRYNIFRSTLLKVLRIQM